MDKFIVYAPSEPETNIWADVQTWIAANPGARFGSLTDLQHAGWLLHVLIPV